MEAVRSFAIVHSLVLWCLCSAFAPSLFAGGARTRNFIVSSNPPEIAQAVAEAAERYRRELAIEWLGDELPPWPQPCPITVQASPRLGAGGATTFTFTGNTPHSWTMQVQGSYERVLDSVLPHEVTHTIFATYFGRPLPRWADEGACTTVEHTSEREKQEQLLYQFLTTNRGIAFNRMFAMREYPRDILPLYSQGYSLARYLIALKGKRPFVDYVGQGMATNDWTSATQAHYGFESLSDLQLSWLEWVRQGTPAFQSADDVRYVSTDPGKNGRSLAEVSGSRFAARENSPRVAPAEIRLASSATPFAPTQATERSEAYPPPVDMPTRPAAIRSDDLAAGGWYSRRRDRESDALPRREDATSPSLPPVAGRATALDWSRREESAGPNVSFRR